MKPSLIVVDLLREQGGLCALCRYELQPNIATVDHIIPLAAGGTSEIANLQAAHQKCNLWKGSIVDGWVYCWRCKAGARGEEGSNRHWDKRHPHGFLTAKAWRKAAKADLKSKAVERRDTPHRERIRTSMFPPHAAPWPQPNYVPRTGPYQATKLEPSPAGSNGISADGAVGSP